MTSRIITILGLVLISLSPLVAMLEPGLPTVHDPTSIYRLAALRETIFAGQFPAAWNNFLNNGYGYPLHLFYAPLFNYLGLTFSLVGFDFTNSVKLALVASSLVATFGMYLLMRKFGRQSAILSAAAFTFLPYRAVSLYVRGSYAELLALSLTPILLYSYSRDLSKAKNIILAAVTTSLVLLAHNTLILLIIPLLFFYLLVMKRSNWQQIWRPLLLGFGLSAWFIIPVIFERHLIQVATIASNTLYSDHFLTITQLWHSPWGYGGSAPGPHDGMSFVLGKAHILLALIGATYLLVKKRFRFLFFALPSIVIAIFLTTASSEPIWDLFKPLQMLQFPWRSLSIVTLIISILLGFSIKLIPDKLKGAITFALIAAIVTINLKYFTPQAYELADYSHQVGQYPANLAKDKFPEFLPSSMPIFLAESSDELTSNAVSKSGSIEVDENGQITLTTAYMPQWRLVVDNEAVAINPDKNGLIQVSGITPGTHQIELSWERTVIEKVAILISVVSFLILLGLLR